MKKEDIKKPNPDALAEAAQVIIDLVNIKPTDDFFESIEETELVNNNTSKKLPKVATSVSIENRH